jgi:hypothetical protein
VAPLGAIERHGRGGLSPFNVQRMNSISLIPGFSRGIRP